MASGKSKQKKREMFAKRHPEKRTGFAAVKKVEKARVRQRKLQKKGRVGHTPVARKILK